MLIKLKVEDGAYLERIIMKNLPEVTDVLVEFDWDIHTCTVYEDIKVSLWTEYGERHTADFYFPYIDKNGEIVNRYNITSLMDELMVHFAPKMKSCVESSDIKDWLDRPEEAVKHDEGKLRMDLIAPEMLTSMAEVLTMGAEKYGDKNWELGLDKDRLYAAAMRHLCCWRAGQALDSESGIHHAKHALVNLGMLCTFIERDDDV